MLLLPPLVFPHLFFSQGECLCDVSPEQVFVVEVEVQDGGRQQGLLEGLLIDLTVELLEEDLSEGVQQSIGDGLQFVTVELEILAQPELLLLVEEVGLLLFLVLFLQLSVGPIDEIFLALDFLEFVLKFGDELVSLLDLVLGFVLLREISDHFVEVIHAQHVIAI